MCKKFVYFFLVFGFCVVTARGDLTLIPLSTWDITGDFGDILSLNDYPASSLVTGTSEFANPPGQSGNELAPAADDFTLYTAACADGQDWMRTVFNQPVNIIFILEKNGNDSGTIQALDADGNPSGNPITFTGGSSYWTNTGYLASFLSTQQNTFGAMLTSDTPIYGILITAPGIDPVSILAVRGEVGLCSDPKPANGATDVPRDVVTSWTPGIYAQTHDVYFGKVLEDVENADRDNPLDVLASQNQDANTYEPGILEFGQTYFWRIDEVNAPPDLTIHKGKVWNFTIEPVSYPIRDENITPAASSSMDNEPDKTIDGSGLVDDLHTVDTKTMWLSDTGDPGSAWIQYNFDKLYKLHQMLVWNYNGSSILTGYGFKEVTIEYSEDGQNWTVLSGSNEFAKATGKDGYQNNTIVDFNGAAAKSVKITANSNWGGTIFNQFGLSEVRFLYIPVNARQPIPDSGATDVDVDMILGWRAGREAAEHKVYLSTDEQAVIDGIAPAVTVTDAGYSPSEPLILDSKYYWRVDEVNDAETPATWEGDIWSFSTQEYLVVENFESYNDLPAEEEGSKSIYMVWIDGFDNPSANGSTIGYIEPFQPSMEAVIVHGGKQSVPLSYDNSVASLSEVTVNTSDLAIGTDWSKGGAQTLVLWFHGNSDNSPTEQMYVKINDAKVTYPGDAADTTRAVWKQWNIDLGALGIDLSNVARMSIGLERTEGIGSSGMVLIDDICMYRSAPAAPLEEIWIEAEKADTISSPLITMSDVPGTSGGEYITVVTGNNSTDEPPAEGVAAYAFTVEGGTYKVLGRVITYNLDTGDDSCWIRIQGADTQTTNHSSGWVRWNDIELGQDWHWDVVHSSEDGNTEVEWTMGPGTYTLEFAYREDGLLLDAIVISKLE